MTSVQSPHWADTAPDVTVVIATHQRVAMLPELVAALEAQDHPRFEVVVADDGSTDGTWDELVRLAAQTSLPLLALRLPASGGPSAPRNAAAARGRGRVLAVTDDDCLPERGWLSALTDAGTGVVQGCTLPVDQDHGPWDRSIEVRGLSGLWESCNLALPAALFHELGGFPVVQVLAGRARGFGEDVLLGAAASRRVGAVFAADAVVRHRWLPGSFGDHLRSRRRLSGFPLLAREVPELRDRLWWRVFLSRRTATVDLGLAGLAAALLLRRPWPLLAAVPWLRQALRDGRRVDQVMVGDVVAAASLVEGSARHRSAVL